MSNVIGIYTSGVSNQAMRDQLLRQLNANQTQMSQLETEISTGYQFQLPSQNPLAAMQVEGIQSMLERKTQAQTNISTNQNYLSQTDSTLTSVSDLLTSIQSTALSAVGSTASSSQRQTVIQQIDQAVQQLVSLGNTQFNGQSLFSGMNSAETPFSVNAAGNVVYSGSAEPNQSYVDVNQIMATSITGDQAFGAISQPVQGASLTPALSLDTPLADLNGGKGVEAGSIAISDGHTTSIVNLSGAQTLGDVATLIEQNPPAGRTVEVDVTPTGLTLQLQPDPDYPSGDNLSVQEVGSTTTAADLGILNVQGTGSQSLVGQTLTSTIAPTTPLSSLLGAQAQANIHFGVPNSDIILQANTPGAALNGITVHFDSNASAAGDESATYDGSTLTVHISTSPTSASRASQIVAAINKVPGLPFTASLDPADQNGGGQPPITSLPADTTTAGGSGTSLDTSGLLITSAGKTYTVSLSGDKTVQDLLNGINDSGAGLEAELNPEKTGINVVSRVSGADFTIGENGGTTATQLGLRTFTASTPLSQLNSGAGVGVNTTTAGGTDFTIGEMIDGTAVQVPVSIAGDTTVADVINTINTAAQKAGATFSAQLATTGNGIELTDSNLGAGQITVTANSQSTAAVDLGLVPAGETSASSPLPGTASGTEASDSNNELLIQAVDPTSYGKLQVVFNTDNNLSEGAETVQLTGSTLTFTISPQSTANDVIAALQNSAYSSQFTASLDTSSDTNNNGTGIVQAQTIPMTSGTATLGSNSELTFQAVDPGTYGNAQVQFQVNPASTAGNETVNYDSTADTLTFTISPQSTANDIIAALQNSAYSGQFTASLDTSSDANNNGTGVVQAQTIQMSGGQDSATPGGTASGTEASAGDNELLIRAVDPATDGNAQVAFQTDSSLPMGDVGVQYSGGTLTFYMAPGTTANDIVGALQNSAFSGQFTAALDTSHDPDNNGNGIVQQQTISMTDGAAALGSNSELQIQAVDPGTYGNVQVQFQSSPLINPGSETVSYNPTAGTLTFNISPESTANDIIAALQNSACGGQFTASLDTSADPNNNGSGVVQSQTIQMSGGQNTLTGSDTNPQQTDSVFNALIKLGAAFQDNNSTAIQQGMTLLSNSMQTVNSARDQLGVQEQSLTTINTQISNEQISLQSAMSNLYDTDMASAAADYTSAEITYQATLQTTASILKTTLLNYL